MHSSTGGNPVNAPGLVFKSSVTYVRINDMNGFHKLTRMTLIVGLVFLMLSQINSEFSRASNRISKKKKIEKKKEKSPGKQSNNNFHVLSTVKSDQKSMRTNATPRYK